MSKTFLLKILPAIFFWAITTLVLLKVPYPESLPEATSFQLIALLIPLLLALTASLNLLIKHLLSSFILSLGLTLLLILKSLSSLNTFSGVSTIIAVSLLISYFRRKDKNLTSGTFIPKLKSLRRKK